VASLTKATAQHLSFLGNDKYRPLVLSSLANIVLVPLDYGEPPPERRAWIKCKNPSDAFTSLTVHFAPPTRKPGAGIHDTAVIDSTAQIAASAHVGAHVVVGENTTVGERSVIEAGSYVGHHVTMGNDCRLFPRVTILDGCILGNQVVIHSGTVIGSDGFGFLMSAAGHKKIPQTGIVQIDDDVEIGANATIDRARFERTWIQQGVRIDNLVQIAHNVIVGKNSVIVAQVGISGSAEIGNQVILAGQAGIAGHITIGDRATILGQAGVINSVEPGAILVGLPAIPRRQFWKQTAYFQNLPDLHKKVKKLEAELAELKSRLSESQ
jgi:UDP-3-O-[3-hydroxymyristoyl] glucosamine N-acyltransferase